LQDLEGSLAVDQKVSLRIVHRVLIGEMSGEMKNVVDFLGEGLLQRFVIQYAALDKDDGRVDGDIPPGGSGQVIKDDDFRCPGRNQGFRQIGADTAGAAGDDDILRLIFL
jgi:hypothetical protein